MPGNAARPVLHDAEHSRGAEIEILLEASEAAAAHTLDLDSLMDALAALVRKIVDFEMYALLVPEEDKTLRVAHSVGYEQDLLRDLRVPIGEGLTGRAARTLETVRVDDVRRDSDYLRKVDAVRSELAIPLVARDKLVAVLDLESARPDAFDVGVSDLLELVASRFSLAIDVSQLYQAQAQQHSTLQTLQRIAQEFSQILHLDELLSKISTLLRTLIHFDVLAIYLKDPSEPLLRHYFGVRFDERVRWREIPIGAGLVGAAAELRVPVLVHDTSQDSRYIASQSGIQSEVAIPLVLKNELVGVLDLQSASLGAYSNEDARTLATLAPQVAAAIENARLYEEKELGEARLERDLAAARALQSHLLPKGRFAGAGIEIAAHNEPAALVSGDFYDYYQRDGSVAILNADVSGKGAAAAIYAALASGLIANSAAMGLGPGESLDQANRWLLDRNVAAKFVAACFAVWNPSSSRLTIAGAGMPVPYVSRAGCLEPVHLEGVPLGLFRNSEYDEISFELQPGDIAVTLSDGFSESLNAAGEMYGEERVLAVLASVAGEPTDTILASLFEDVGKFSEGRPPTDDRTAIVVRVTG